MVSRVINAVFKSKCNTCGTVIAKGELSTYDTDKKKMYCARCRPINGQKPAPKPEPEKKKEPQTVKHEVTLDIEKELKKLNDAVDKETPKIHERVKGTVEEMIQKEFGTLPRCIIEVKKDGQTKTIKEITHVKFTDILKLIQGNIPVFLMGAAGCGKNHICKQVADALELDFYFTNAVSNEYKITGFIDANGKYHETQFYEAFTKGGLFFFDEIDASVPEVLVLLNAAIENRYFNFPTGKVDAHPDFRVIAAGNTYGNGASVQYVGRYQLDAASLDRFALIEIDYDEKVELLIGNNDKVLVDFIHEVRKSVRKNNLRVVVSYRAIHQIATMMYGQGMELKTALEYSLLKGISVDDMTIIYNEIKYSENKYTKEYVTLLKSKINSRG
jgi:hypothetical protein